MYPGLILSKVLLIDLIVIKWVELIRSPYLDRIFSVLTYLGSPQVFALLLIIITVYLLYRQKKTEAVFLLITLMSSWGFEKLLKQLFQRSRPPGEALILASGYSFPSGHAMVSIAFYGFLAYLLIHNIKGKKGRVLAALIYLLIIVIGFSRVYLNVHYITDVLAGFLFGAIMLELNIILMRKRKKEL